MRDAPPCPFFPQDDVADHDRWAAHFGATRIMHRSDVRVPFPESPSSLPPVEHA